MLLTSRDGGGGGGGGGRCGGGGHRGGGGGGGGGGQQCVEEGEQLVDEYLWIRCWRHGGGVVLGGEMNVRVLRAWTATDSKVLTSSEPELESDDERATLLGAIAI